MFTIQKSDEEKLKLRFGTNQIDMQSSNPYLSSAMRVIRLNRKTLDADYAYTLSYNEDTAMLWIQTPPCKYSQMGRCTICNYWKGNRVRNAIDLIVQNEHLKENCSTLLINTCGSCLDPYELPIDEQNSLFEWVDSSCCRDVIVETHADTINRESIERVMNHLRHKTVFFEFGVESVSHTVLYYCLNKTKPKRELCDIVRDINSAGAYSIANVVLGAPFLTADEQIADVVNSIRTLTKVGIDYIVLFPINIKPDTLPFFLVQNNMYSTVRVDMAVDVLARLPEYDLSKIDIAWYGEHQEPGVVPPYYCPVCQKNLLSSIAAFNSEKTGEKRRTILQSLQKMRCNCDNIPESPFYHLTPGERVYLGYEYIETIQRNGGII